MTEALNCEVAVSVYHDVWSILMANTNKIRILYRIRKNRLQYLFHLFVWEVGGEYVYPTNGKTNYHHDRGFHECFLKEHNKSVQVYPVTRA
jgi:L-ascorbate 6-phosphate lactonase